MSKSGSSVRESVNIPLIEDLSQDIGDGCSLAVLISFYCPSALSRQGQHTSGSVIYLTVEMLLILNL